MPPQQASGSATIGSVLRDAKQRLGPVSDSASLDAQLLLAEVLQVSRAHVIAHREKLLTSDQAAAYGALINRRALGEPVAYLLGRRAFYDREFYVTPDVLIPRPETEHLLERALERVQPGQVVVDCGTGSGALAVTLAAHVSQARVYATDISERALAVARENAAANKVDVHFLHGDLLMPLIDGGIRADLVMANLPYIPTEDMDTLEVSQHEPHLALDGGPDGLDLVRRLLQQVPRACSPDAILLLEIGAEQGPASVRLARELHQSTSVQVMKDYAGHDRLVEIRLL